MKVDERGRESGRRRNEGWKEDNYPPRRMSCCSARGKGRRERKKGCAR
jgi:hypothetical protein